MWQYRVRKQIVNKTLRDCNSLIYEPNLMKLCHKISYILGCNWCKIRFYLTRIKKVVYVFPQKKLQAFQTQPRGRGGHQGDHFHMRSPTALPLRDAPKRIASMKLLQILFEIFYKFLRKFLRGRWGIT